MRGYLAFEDAYVHGELLGRTLAEAAVTVLILNACRSAHSEAPAEPEDLASKAQSSLEGNGYAETYGSLAQEAVIAGISGVVAMQYNIYAVTAAQFVADLYAGLTQGKTLGEAVSLGRQALATHPLREVVSVPRPLQDWMVPIVYEAAPVALLSKPTEAADVNFTVSADTQASVSSNLPQGLEALPEAGFIGLDGTLLGLDRAFDDYNVVLLYGYAGSGKTATAGEFARWYNLTGGIEGPVLCTSFERKRTLSQALNETIESVFAGVLEQLAINWLALRNEERRDVALQLLKQAPVLWIWDNVEPIAGFPAGTQSAWTGAEQEELAEFLRAATSTKAKFLLTLPA
jgi:hypothetical protein